jgi:hypothetical protein
MKKPRSDAALDKLPPNQRAAIDKWLFEENQSYDEVVERCWQDFAVRLSRSSLAGYYQRRKQQEILATIASSSRSAEEVGKTFAENQSKFFEPLMKLIEKSAFDRMCQGESVDVKDVQALTSLVMANFDGQLKVQAEQRKERELALKRERLELEVKKYRDTIATIQSEVNKAKGGGLSAEGLKTIEEAMRLL